MLTFSVGASLQALFARATGGPATAVIAGIGVGMLSTVIQVLAVGAGTIRSFMFASGFDAANMNQGLYGVAIVMTGLTISYSIL